MKRVAVLLVVAIFIVAGIYSYRLFSARSARGISSADAAIFPTAPAPCPSDPNDLAGIEGYAPGAGGAEKIGQAGSGNMGGLGGALGGGEQATPSPQATEACSGITPEVAQYFDRMDKRMALVPEDGYDPNLRATELGDANAVFAFVRDHIRTEAYEGEMRGPSGTLQSRGGSPIDKAYLLAGMLGAIGVPARLVHGQLGDSEMLQLVNQVATSIPVGLPESPQLADAFKQLGIDANVARRQALDGVAKTDARVDATITAAQAPAAELAAALQQGNAALSADDTALRKAWATNLRDHWWVQVRQGGTWSDWDPSTPDAKPGTHLGAAPTADGIPEPGRDQQTTLAIRVIANYAGASPQSKTLVEASAPMAKIYGMPISLAIGDRSRGTLDLKAATSFTPSISMGSDETTGDAFALDPPGGPRVAALHLQIETDIPGQAPRIVNRTILDRRNAQGAIDDSWTSERSAYAVTTTYTMLAVSGDFDPGFAAQREGEGLKAVHAFVEYVSAGGYGKQLPPAGIAAAYPMEDLHYYEQDALVRHRLEAAANGTLHFFFDRPQIVMMHRALAMRDGKISGIEQFDIVENGMAATGADAQAAIKANFVRGYVDTSIEQHLLAAPGDGGTIALFAAAKHAGIAATVSTDPKFGGIAIVPAAPVALEGHDRVGWWQVEPASGNLVGRMDDGAGQELVEYAIARANDWSTLYSMMQFYGDFFRCIASAVEAPLAGAGGTQAQASFKQCAGAALCNYLEALGSGEAFSRLDSDTLALIYNIMDLSVPGSKDSWPGTLGAVCSQHFSNP